MNPFKTRSENGHAANQRNDRAFSVSAPRATGLSPRDSADLPLHSIRNAPTYHGGKRVRRSWLDSARRSAKRRIGACRAGLIVLMMGPAVLIPACGNSPQQLLGDPAAGQSLPSAKELDGTWVMTVDVAGFFGVDCLDIQDGRPVRYFGGCGVIDTLLTSKPIVFDSDGPVIEFTVLADPATGFALGVTIFATQRTADFYDVVLVVDDGITSVRADGQMERF
ncbi:MAG: hypothetical protein D6788_00085 [Planctomycetota bacterium]|nr:MAG: hypothetical protein D6788_00085 [Planctomycetota bacterium]